MQMKYREKGKIDTVSWKFSFKVNWKILLKWAAGDGGKKQVAKIDFLQRLEPEHWKKVFFAIYRTLESILFKLNNFWSDGFDSCLMFTFFAFKIVWKKD